MASFYEKYFHRKITLVFTVERGIVFFLSLFCTLYLFWELYWYRQVGLACVKQHTHFMVLLGLFLGLYFLRKLLRSTSKVFPVLFSLLFFLGLVEFFYAVTGLNKTFFEERYGYYLSPYEPRQHTHTHTWKPEEKNHWLITPEFSYQRPTNSLGFADTEWPLPAKDSGSIRILALGDSFTEGDGAAFDSSYVAFLGRMLDSSDRRYRVLNGGICGTDPFEDYMNLKMLLLRHKPGVIIQTLSSGDILHDIAVKGGFERFLPNGSLQYRKPPWWEPIYALSYFSRVFFSMAGYNSLLVNENDSSVRQYLYGELAMLFQEYQRFCRQNGMELVLVLRPNVEEVKNGQYHFDFEPLKKEPQVYGGVKLFDLMPYYQQAATTQGPIDAYFWKKDGHHNAKGYRLMAEGIHSFLVPVLDTLSTPKLP